MRLTSVQLSRSLETNRGVVLLAGTLHHVVHVAFAPHLGVANVIGVVVRIVLVLQDRLLGAKVRAVSTGNVHGVGLAAAVDVVIALGVLELDIAGVEDVHGAVLHVGAAGVHAAHVKGLVGVQRGAVVVPAHHVVAGGVAPHLDATLGVERRVLEVSVIGVAQLAEAVGVVEPAHGRGQVKRLSVGPEVGGLLKCLAQGIEVLRKRVSHVALLRETRTHVRTHDTRLGMVHPKGTKHP